MRALGLLTSLAPPIHSRDHLPVNGVNTCKGLSRPLEKETLLESWETAGFQWLPGKDGALAEAGVLKIIVSPLQGVCLSALYSIFYLEKTPHVVCGTRSCRCRCWRTFVIPQRYLVKPVCEERLPMLSELPCSLLVRGTLEESVQQYCGCGRASQEAVMA